MCQLRVLQHTHGKPGQNKKCCMYCLSSQVLHWLPLSESRSGQNYRQSVQPTHNPAACHLPRAEAFHRHIESEHSNRIPGPAVHSASREMFSCSPLTLIPPRLPISTLPPRSSASAQQQQCGCEQSKAATYMAGLLLAQHGRGGRRYLCRSGCVMMRHTFVCEQWGWVLTVAGEGPVVVRRQPQAQQVPPLLLLLQAQV